MAGGPDRIYNAHRSVESDRRQKSKEAAMLRWALAFLVVALVAGVFGFAGIAAVSAGVAKILFFLSLILFLASLIGHFLRRTRPDGTNFPVKISGTAIRPRDSAYRTTQNTGEPALTSSHPTSIMAQYYTAHVKPMIVLSGKPLAASPPHPEC